jgi:hypothetical protein
VLAWDPAHPHTAARLGSHDDVVWAVAALADGRVVSGGGDLRVLVWNPAGTTNPVVQLSCSVWALATLSPGPAESNLVIAHQGSGFSLWSLTG